MAEVETPDNVAVTLSQLVDLSLCTTEMGSVNFALLQSILHIMLQQLGYANVQVNFSGKDSAKIQDLLLLCNKETIPSLTNFTVIDPLIKPQDIFPEDGLESTFIATEVEHLKRVVNNLIHKPDEIVEAVHNTVVDMIEVIKLMKRVDATEQGIDKIAYLLDQLIQKENLNAERLQKVENCCNIKNEGGTEVIEHAFRGEEEEPINHTVASLKEELEKLMKLCQESANNALLWDEKFGDMFKEMELFKGTIRDIKEQVDNNINMLNTTVCVPADTPIVQPDETQFKKLMKLILDVKRECENVIKETKELKDSHSDSLTNINKILDEIDKLRVDKTSRNEMNEALNDKADRCQLNAKVSVDDFDEAIENLHNGLEHTLQLIQKQDDLWNEAMEQVTKALDEKLSKADIKPFKDYVNTKFKCILEKIKALAVVRQQQDAAGAKKLLRDVTCISCDRNAVMLRENEQKKEAPYFPGPVQNVAPYLAYELDQIRKQQRCLTTGKHLKCFEAAMKTSKVHRKDHVCTRYCGGSHTIISPEQRVQRMSHFVDTLKVIGQETFVAEKEDLSSPQFDLTAKQVGDGDLPSAVQQQSKGVSVTSRSPSVAARGGPSLSIKPTTAAKPSITSGTSPETITAPMGKRSSALDKVTHSGQVKHPSTGSAAATKATSSEAVKTASHTTAAAPVPPNNAEVVDSGSVQPTPSIMIEPSPSGVIKSAPSGSAPFAPDATASSSVGAHLGMDAKSAGSLTMHATASVAAVGSTNDIKRASIEQKKEISKASLKQDIEVEEGI